MQNCGSPTENPKTKSLQRRQGCPNDPEATITRMNNGTTHLACKAQHSVALDSDLIVSVAVHTAVTADAETVIEVELTREDADIENDVQMIVTDNRYNSNKVMTFAAEVVANAVIPDLDAPTMRRWTDKPARTKNAFYNNRRRKISHQGKHLSQVRSEMVERSFAHVCDTRQACHRVVENVTKRHLMRAASRCLLVIMRILCGNSTPLESAGAPDAHVTNINSLQKPSSCCQSRYHRGGCLRSSARWSRYHHLTFGKKLRRRLRPRGASRLWAKSAAAGCGEWQPRKSLAFFGVDQVEKGHGRLLPRAARTITIGETGIPGFNFGDALKSNDARDRQVTQRLRFYGKNGSMRGVART
jgi:hypothetical protein